MLQTYYILVVDVIFNRHSSMFFFRCYEFLADIKFFLSSHHQSIDGVDHLINFFEVNHLLSASVENNPVLSPDLRTNPRGLEV